MDELMEPCTDRAHRAPAYKDLVLDSGARDLPGVFQDNTAIRRAALAQQDRSLGLPHHLLCLRDG